MGEALLSLTWRVALLCVWCVALCVGAGKALLLKLGELVPKLKSRMVRLQAEAAAIRAEQPGAAQEGGGAGAGKKKGKKKGKR
jgi:hypothetical protein